MSNPTDSIFKNIDKWSMISNYNLNKDNSINHVNTSLFAAFKIKVEDKQSNIYGIASLTELKALLLDVIEYYQYRVDIRLEKAAWLEYVKNMASEIDPFYYSDNIKNIRNAISSEECMKSMIGVWEFDNYTNPTQDATIVFNSGNNNLPVIQLSLIIHGE